MLVSSTKNKSQLTWEGSHYNIIENLTKKLNLKQINILSLSRNPQKTGFQVASGIGRPLHTNNIFMKYFTL
jgi:hypothetical protein